ncbi:UNKNOWN [Stylonychia lemnae]|uniref:Uncharacterized protein n=1 Tax=Stylonychia lemnae TaxID=5949 RepID=A0A078BE17_STYLE|nr:UNKNOWN [Stylonychia lemnae]|eukprot:CDW91823.1 UNKNOWN [Stylonychia lemnae]
MFSSFISFLDGPVDIDEFYNFKEPKQNPLNDDEDFEDKPYNDYEFQDEMMMMPPTDVSLINHSPSHHRINSSQDMNNLSGRKNQKSKKSTSRTQSIDNPQIISQSQDLNQSQFQNIGNNRGGIQSLNTTTLSYIDHRNNTSKSFLNGPQISAFDRLYYSGLQRKASKERRMKEKQDIEEVQELSLMQKQPKISLISSEVAKTLRERPKMNDFLEYSMEWQKLRDAKIQQAKMMQETKIVEESKPVNFNGSNKIIGDNYKGVVSGYYDQVNKFFERKRHNLELGQAKPEGIPQIKEYRKKSRSKSATRHPLNPQANVYNLSRNQQQHDLPTLTSKTDQQHTLNTIMHNTSDVDEFATFLSIPKKSQIDDYLDQNVEQRLIKKGQEYKNNLNHKRHEVIQDMIREGPTFQPKLIANNEAYLKNIRTEEDVTKRQNDIGSHMYCQAMVFLINKQTKIIENRKVLYEQQRVPEVNAKSREMLQNIIRKPLYEISQPKTNTANSDLQKKQQDPEVVKRKKEKMADFIQRNYEREMKAKALKAEINKKETNSIESLQKQGIVFKPQLSTGTMNLITQRQQRQAPTFEELYREANIKRLKHKELVAKNEKEKQQQELKDAPFKPTINKSSIQIIQQKVAATPFQQTNPIVNPKLQSQSQKYEKLNDKKQALQKQQLEKVQQKNGANNSYLQMHYQNQQRDQQQKSNQKVGGDLTKNVSFGMKNYASNSSITYSQTSNTQNFLSDKKGNELIFVQQIDEASQSNINYDEKSPYKTGDDQANNLTIQESSSQRRISHLLGIPQMNNNSNYERKRSSELNKTIESNLLDFNDDRLFEETQKLAGGDKSSRTSSIGGVKHSDFLMNTGNFAQSYGDNKIQGNNNRQGLGNSIRGPDSNGLGGTAMIGGTNDVIEGFLQDMQNAAVTQSSVSNMGQISQPIEKIIEDARRALMEYDDSSLQEQQQTFDTQEIKRKERLIKHEPSKSVPQRQIEEMKMKFDTESISIIGGGSNQNMDQNTFVHDSAQKSQFSTDQHTPVRQNKSPKSESNLISQPISSEPLTNSNNILEEDQEQEQEDDNYSINNQQYAAEDSIQPFNPPTQSNMIADRNQSTMNKTLSLIEEENEDEFYTNNEDDRVSSSQFNNNFGDTRKLYPNEVTDELRRLDEDNSQSNISNTLEISHVKSIADMPFIVRDIESMEKQFTKFLEQIYN